MNFINLFLRKIAYLLMVLFVSGNLVALSISENKHNYNLKYYEYSLVQDQSIGVIIPCYNRPEYLKKLLESLGKNNESQHLPFFFVVDGGPNSKQKEIVQLIQDSKITNKEIILRNRNYGLPKNLIDARRFMFDWCKFDKIIFIEDDLIVSPTYIKTLLNLWDWSQANYDNVGVVQSCRYCFMTKQEKTNALNLVRASDREWNVFDSYCMSRDVWNKMSVYLYDFEKIIDTIPHTNEFETVRSKLKIWKDKKRITDWARSLIPQKDNLMEKFSLEKTFPSKNLKNKFLNLIPYQDVIMAFSLWMTGYVKVQTVVNRVHHIGQIGTNFDKKSYKNLNKNQMRLDDFCEDEFLYNFKSYKNSQIFI